MRILVIDDDPIAQLMAIESLKRGLHDLAPQFERADSLQEGRAALRRAPVQLALIDWMLPDGEGDALGKELVESDSEVVIALHTSKMNLEDEAPWAVKHPRVIILYKPWNGKEKLDVIRELLNRED